MDINSAIDVKKAKSAARFVKRGIAHVLNAYQGEHDVDTVTWVINHVTNVRMAL